MQGVVEDWFSDEISTFGDRVAGARESLSMTQNQLSERLGVKLKTIQAWENDLSEPRSNKLMRLSGVLNVSIMWLLNGEGDGVNGPDEPQNAETDGVELLSEISVLTKQMATTTKRLTVLEKKLRAYLKG